MVKGGSIVEQGSHVKLMEDPDGSYAALYKLQQTAPTKEKPSFEEMQASFQSLEALHLECIYASHVHQGLSELGALQQILDGITLHSDSVSAPHITTILYPLEMHKIPGSLIESLLGTIGPSSGLKGTRCDYLPG